jgi:hypothetical protein
MVRGLLIFSAFRAVYGLGILVATYALATGSALPWWSSLVFLGCSMVFSRWLFRGIKRRWPTLFTPQGVNTDSTGEAAQTTP